MTDGRIRPRQGTAVLVDGVPYSNPDTTLSLLPGAAVGRWLHSRSSEVSGRLLDLGAGNQPYRPWYAPKAEHVFASDVVPAEGLDVVSMATALPFRTGSFDTLLCTSMLEHVEEIDLATSEIGRVLRAGGRLLLTVPFLYPTHEAPYDFWRVTHHGMRALLERHGFEVEDLSAEGGPVLLCLHYMVLAVVHGLRFLSRRLGPLGRIAYNRWVEAVIAAPQNAVRAKVGYRLTPLSRIISMGYMASARKRSTVPLGAGRSF